VRKHGINPVTISPTRGGYKLTLGRLHLVKPDESVEKFVTAAMWSSENEIPVLASFDEDIFIDALGYLFPHGELDGANLRDG
jgi:hypothetical protein